MMNTDSKSSWILAIDQGTTSSRAIAFSEHGKLLQLAQQEFKQIYPHPGWVEHDANEIWQSTTEVIRQTMAKCDNTSPRAIGITNQRETVVIWDRATGKPIYNALVWQDRRTAQLCEQLKKNNVEPTVKDKTGLLLDPYFSATKIAWLLDHVDGLRSLAKQGKLAFGTTDSYILWQLTGGQVHATDATNAARTLLFNIHEQQWDKDLLALFNIPKSLLPDVFDSAYNFGKSRVNLFDRAVPICGIAGDQQAAAIGQACIKPGMVKSTYGTGCFALLNTGSVAVKSKHKLLTTIASRISGHTQYALEGSIFVAGAAIQWLRDELNIISDAKQTEQMAKSINSNEGVYFVPALTGLGAPHWDAHARGAIYGLTRGSGRAHIARAALESIAYQTSDLIRAMQNDSNNEISNIRVDGGMVNNDWLCQFIADILQVDIQRPKVTETTALGAAYLACIGAGIYGDLNEIRDHWQLQHNFIPEMDASEKDSLLVGWQNALTRTLDSIN